MNIIDLIIAFRGGLPDKCDFCGKPYGDERHPIPEEAGAWSCTECEWPVAFGDMSATLSKEESK